MCLAVYSGFKDPTIAALCFIQVIRATVPEGDWIFQIIHSIRVIRIIR